MKGAVGWRLACKRAMCRAIAGFGPRVVTERGRRWLCDRLVPLVLDDAILPKRVSARPLRRGGGSVLCDPYLHTHRPTYWCGVLYEAAMERFIRRHVGPGDTFIDVGSNLGHLSTVAGWAVGASGRVLGFEANPTLAEMTRRHFESQGLDQVRIHPWGLGEAAGREMLRIDPEHPGHSTLRNGVAEGPKQPMTDAAECEIRVGDLELAEARMPGRVFLKVDVEGFELEVLRGLRETLRDRVGCAVVEVTPGWLGGFPGVECLFGLMREAGLRARRLRPDGRVGPPITAAEVEEQQNIVFVSEDERRRRIPPDGRHTH